MSGTGGYRLKTQSGNAAMRRPMTVLQVLPALDSGGVERGTVDVDKALIAAGHRALVASRGGRLATGLGQRHITLPLDSKNPYTIWRNADRLAAVIEEHTVDVVHARSRAPAWSAWLAARRTGRAFVTTFHAAYSADSPLKLRYNAVMGYGARVIAISRFIQRHITSTYGVPAERIALIPRGIDLVRFTPDGVHPSRVVALAQRWQLDESRPVLLLPGRLSRIKGHMMLIAALDLLRDVPFQCLMVGEAGANAGYQRELEAAIDAGNHQGRLRLVGHCEDMPAALRLADVVLNLSQVPEGFGRVMAEALAMERPLIATSLGAAPEIVADDWGWLIPHDEALALAHAIRATLSQSTEDRARRAALGRAHVAKHYDLKGMTQRTLEVYEQADLLTRAKQRR